MLYKYIYNYSQPLYFCKIFVSIRFLIDKQIHPWVLGKAKAFHSEMKQTFDKLV